jgi:hypothetical protein
MYNFLSKRNIVFDKGVGNFQKDQFPHGEFKKRYTLSHPLSLLINAYIFIFMLNFFSCSPFICHLQAQGALMYDSVFVLVEAFNRIIRKKPDQFRAYTMRRQTGQTNVTATAAAAGAKFVDCNTSKGGWVTQWEHGERIAKNLRKVEIEGLTGEIRFSEEGRRINYTLHIVEMTGKNFNFHTF